MKKKCQIYYTPNIHVWHPTQNSVNFSKEKIASYGRGFGAFARKNVSAPIIFLFIEIIVYHLLLYVLSLVKNDEQGKKAQKISIVSRLQGWRLYN